MDSSVKSKCGEDLSSLTVLHGFTMLGPPPLSPGLDPSTKEEEKVLARTLNNEN